MWLGSKVVGAGRLALPRLFDSESNRSAIPCEPHAVELQNADCKLKGGGSGLRNLHSKICNLQLKMAHPAGLSPADSPFEAEHDSSFTTDAENGRSRW